MSRIFKEKDFVIDAKTPVITSILELGPKTPDEAKKYIKDKRNLSSRYYHDNENDSEKIYLQFMNRLFNENNIEHSLTEEIGENVYKPWDHLSQINQIKINERMGLIVQPDGVTKNNESIIINDYYYHTIYSKTRKRIEVILLASMAVWKAKKGIYIIHRAGQTIKLEFDDKKWKNIFDKIKLWAETAI